MILAAIPIKPFGVAKARLAPVLGPEQRSRLGRAIAERTAGLAATAGAEVVVVTPDHGVEKWAKSLGHGVVIEDPADRRGLDAAAASAARHAAGMGLPWVIVHADLPSATDADLRRVFEAALDGPVIVASHDGGTNLLGGRGTDFPFSYGRGSFHRHLAAAPGAEVIANPRLALDLDRPRDLERARAMPTGRWLDGIVDAG